MLKPDFIPFRKRGLLFNASRVLRALAKLSFRLLSSILSSGLLTVAEFETLKLVAVSKLCKVSEMALRSYHY